MTPRKSRAALTRLTHWAMALAVVGALPARDASALDFTLPRFEDLRPKWAALSLGQRPELVLTLMGEPSGRTETVTAGVPHLVLVWKDIRGQQYTARFLAGYLYAKQFSDVR